MGDACLHAGYTRQQAVHLLPGQHHRQPLWPLGSVHLSQFPPFLSAPQGVMLKRMTSLTWSSSLSFGFGMNPSRDLDAFAFPIYCPIFLKNPYGQPLWQALFSPHDAL